MRKIGTFGGKLVEEIGHVNNEMVVFLRVISDEDKDTCPHCGKPVPTEISSVVSSKNHQAYVGETDKLTK